MRRLICAVPRMIEPPLSGGELRVHSLLARLKERWRVTLVCFVDPQDEVRQTAAAMRLENGLVEKVHLVRRTPGAQAPAGLPDTARWFYDPQMLRTLGRVASEERVDLIHFEFNEMGQYAPSLRFLAASVVTEHDASTLSWNRSYLRGEGDFAHRARQWLLRVAFERKVFRSCDKVVVLSDADARRLRVFARDGQLDVVPTGVDLGRFVFQGPGGREPDSVLFIGHFPHFPNEDAAVWLCRDILPKLRERRPGAKALLVGSKVTPPVAALGGAAVEIYDTVPDVRPFLARAQVFIAPMRLGFGIKGKILEAFASGTPVVATASACEAMPGLIAGRHALLGRTPKELADGAARLLDDAELRDRMARAAREYVVSRFGWDRQAELLEATYEEALRNFSTRTK